MILISRNFATRQCKLLQWLTPPIHGGVDSVEGVRFGSEGVRFGSEGVRFMSEGVRFGSEGVRFGLENVRFGLEGVRFGLEGVRFGLEGVWIQSTSQQSLRAIQSVNTTH